MKRLTLITLLIIACLVMTGCSSMHVTVKYDDEVQFSQYQTFRFVKPRHKDSQSVRDPFFTREAMQEIRPLLEEKGFQEAASMEEADLLIHFYAYVRNQADYVPTTYRRGRWGRVHRASPAHVVHYKTGTLVIDVVDADKKEMVWQGVGKGVLDRFDPSTDLVKAVAEVLKDFPPS
ncbi:DUF4136 domain-containing protein [bacterium]|nr:DUF4136 domain-containing protein [bacterium]